LPERLLIGIEAVTKNDQAASRLIYFSYELRIVAGRLARISKWRWTMDAFYPGGYARRVDQERTVTFGLSADCPAQRRAFRLGRETVSAHTHGLPTAFGSLASTKIEPSLPARSETNAWIVSPFSPSGFHFTECGRRLHPRNVLIKGKGLLFGSCDYCGARRLRNGLTCRSRLARKTACSFTQSTSS